MFSQKNNRQNTPYFGNLKSLFLFSLISLFAFVGCGDDENNEAIISKSQLTLNISGLEDLGANYAYEGWIIVDGVPLSAGIFNVDANGELTQKNFEIDAADLNNATAYILTIEPSPDNDPAPSKVHIIGGNFSGNSANLVVDHPMALGTDFSDATGAYILATPTDGSLTTNETSGIWWEDLTTNPVGPSLSLPTLPEGWEYEGWAVIDGIPVSTGRFLDVADFDDASTFSGAQAGPPYPGEDFLTNAPNGLSFPVDLSGEVTAITVEPSPDNSAAPFLLKPLLHEIPNPATPLTLYSMENKADASNPTGSAIRGDL